MVSSFDSTSSPVTTTPSVGDVSPLSITCHKLNGRNFLPWSQSVLICICGHDKEDLLTGTVARPDSSDAKFTAWKVENNLVMSWLINSDIWDWRKFSPYLSDKDWDADHERILAVTTHQNSLPLDLPATTYAMKTPPSLIIFLSSPGTAENWSHRGTWMKMHRGWETLPIHCWKQAGVQISDGLA